MRDPFRQTQCLSALLNGSSCESSEAGALKPAQPGSSPKIIRADFTPATLLADGKTVQAEPGWGIAFPSGWLPVFVPQVSSPRSRSSTRAWLPVPPCGLQGAPAISAAGSAPAPARSRRALGAAQPPFPTPRTGRAEACPAGGRWREPLGPAGIPLPRPGGEKMALPAPAAPHRPAAAPHPCPPRSLPPPPSPCPPLRGGREAAAVYKKPPGAGGKAGGREEATAPPEPPRRVRDGARAAAPWPSPCGATTATTVSGGAGPLGPASDEPERHFLAFTPPGPDRWHENYPMAKGDKQSPIEINSKDVQHDTSLAPWHASYDPGAAKTILNNGRTCRVVFDDTFDRSGRFLVRLLGVVRNWGLQTAGNQNTSCGTWLAEAGRQKSFAYVKKVLPEFILVEPDMFRSTIGGTGRLQLQGHPWNTDSAGRWTSLPQVTSFNADAASSGFVYGERVSPMGF